MRTKELDILVKMAQELPQALRAAAEQLRQQEAELLRLRKEAGERQAVDHLVASGAAADMTEARQQLGRIQSARTPQEAVASVLGASRLDLGTPAEVVGHTPDKEAFLSEGQALERLREFGV